MPGSSKRCDRALHQMAEVLLHAFRASPGPSARGSSVRMARDQADVGRVALVAAAPPGDLHERHASRAGRAGTCPPRRQRFGRELAAAPCGSVTANVVSPSVTVGVTCSFAMSQANCRSTGDTDGRPPAPVVPGDHEVPAGANSRLNISSARRSACVDRQPQHDFARRHGARMRAVSGLGAEQLDVRGGEVARSPLSRSSRRPRSSIASPVRRAFAAASMPTMVSCADTLKPAGARGARPCRCRSAGGRARRSRARDAARPVPCVTWRKSQTTSGSR